MRYLWVVAVLALAVCLLPAVGQELTNQDPELEKILWDVNQRWLCSGPYTKPYKECVESRAQYWVDQFFEVIPNGDLLNKAEMVSTQASRIPSNPPLGTGPYPDGFKLRAVYGDFAMGTDQTSFKTVDENGRLVFTSNSKVLRLFVKENGTWRPAAAGLVPIIPGARPTSAPIYTFKPRQSPNDQIEKELAEVNRQWMDSTDMNRRVAVVARLFTDRWFEILGWNPTGNTIKLTTLETLAKFAGSNSPPGVVSDQFQLQAVFGDVALASDRRIRTWTNAKGQVVKTPHRTILVFVKQNGQWRSAGASLTPIMERQ